MTAGDESLDDPRDDRILTEDHRAESLFELEDDPPGLVHPRLDRFVGARRSVRVTVVGTAVRHRRECLTVHVLMLNRHGRFLVSSSPPGRIELK